MKSATIIVATLLASNAVPARQQVVSQPTFDVISIKPSQPGASNRLPRKSALDASRSSTPGSRR